MKQKLQFSEKDLLRATLKLLSYYNDIYTVRNNSFQGRIMRGNGSTGYIKNSQRGAPDIIICRHGLWCGLELKSSTGKMSPEQKQAEKQIRQAGGHYFLIRDLSEVKKIIEYF